MPGRRDVHFHHYSTLPDAEDEGDQVRAAVLPARRCFKGRFDIDHARAAGVSGLAGHLVLLYNNGMQLNQRSAISRLLLSAQSAEQYLPYLYGLVEKLPDKEVPIPNICACRVSLC